MMRFASILLLLFAATIVRGQSLESALGRFDDGNRLYAEGEFEKALERYRTALDAGFESGALYYNMGNAFFRMDRLGEAVRHYEKARRHLPGSRELSHNLAIARELTADSFSRLPEPFWRSAWDAARRSIGSSGLFAIGWLAYVALLGLLAIRLTRGRSDWLRRGLVAAACASVLFLGMGFAASVDASTDIRAVILQDEVVLMDRAAGSRTDRTVHEGTVVDVLSVRNEWSQVRLPNGTSGWLRTSAYGTI